MHNLDGVISILLALKLDESIALMLISDFVSRDVDVDDWATLGKQLPEDILCDFLVETARVDCCFLVALVE